jgi:hypothetical protein
MSGAGRKWSRAKAGKPTQLPGVRFPNDDLGRRAKLAWFKWKATLSKFERTKLDSAPR